jgi:hypothetical protein
MNVYKWLTDENAGMGSGFGYNAVQNLTENGLELRTKH